MWCIVFTWHMHFFLYILQIGEEMSQNSFIKQYLAKQQELLRQRMEREAREAAEADGKTQVNNRLKRSWQQNPSLIPGNKSVNLCLEITCAWLTWQSAYIDSVLSGANVFLYYTRCVSANTTNSHTKKIWIISTAFWTLVFLYRFYFYLRMMLKIYFNRNRRNSECVAVCSLISQVYLCHQKILAVFFSLVYVF